MRLPLFSQVSDGESEVRALNLVARLSLEVFSLFNLLVNGNNRFSGLLFALSGNGHRLCGWALALDFDEIVFGLLHGLEHGLSLVQRSGFLLFKGADFTICFGQITALECLSGLLFLVNLLLHGFIDLLLVVVLLSDLLKLILGSASSLAHTFSFASLVILGPLILVPAPSPSGPGSDPSLVPATAPVLLHVPLSCGSFGSGSSGSLS